MGVFSRESNYLRRERFRGIFHVSLYFFGGSGREKWFIYHRGNMLGFGLLIGRSRSSGAN
jgi:hypothetical protein